MKGRRRKYYTHYVVRLYVNIKGKSVSPVSGPRDSTVRRMISSGNFPHGQLLLAPYALHRSISSLVPVTMILTSSTLIVGSLAIHRPGLRAHIQRTLY